MQDIPILEVYLDMLFILNFIMDFLIFWLVSKITYQKVSIKSLCLGSSIASVLYCLMVIIPFFRTKNIILFIFILPLLPIQIIFKPKHIKKWIQIFIISNLVALIIGGMYYAMISWIQEQAVLLYFYRNKSTNFSVWILIFSSLLSYLLIKIARYYAQVRNTENQKLYKVGVWLNGNKIDFDALLDTGNRVYEPMSKLPVLIAEYEVLKDLLPKEIRKAYFEQEDITSLVAKISNYDIGLRIRLIPYHSLGNPNGILLGFRPDNISIEADNFDVRSTNDVIVAIYKQTLSTDNIYQGLLHADLISGG